MAMTDAERQRRFRAKARAGYCITCTKRKAIANRAKCPRCAYEALASVYVSRGKEPPAFEQWNRKRKAKAKK